MSILYGINSLKIIELLHYLLNIQADVTHPGPGDTSMTESIAAVVGSLDTDCSYYVARLYAQKTPRGQAYEVLKNINSEIPL